MQQTINLILTTSLTWLTEPQTIAALTLFLMRLPSIIQAFKKAKKDEYIKLASTLAIEMSERLLKETMDNSEKSQVVIGSIYRSLPDNAKKYISEQKMLEIVNGAYHTYVKNKGS